MSGPRRIFVDFNSRVKRADSGEYYQVSLREIDGLAIGSRVLASDFEDIELPVVVTAILHKEKAALVKVVRASQLPAVITFMSGPAHIADSQVTTGSLKSLGQPVPA